MPDIPMRPPTRLSEARERFQVALEWFLENAGSSALVAALALGLAFLRIEIQYVLGAFLVVFAHRLSQKRFYPEVNLPESPRPRPVREVFKGREDSLNEITRSGSSPL